MFKYQGTLIFASLRCQWMRLCHPDRVAVISSQPLGDGLHKDKIPHSTHGACCNHSTASVSCSPSASATALPRTDADTEPGMEGSYTARGTDVEHSHAFSASCTDGPDNCGLDHCEPDQLRSPDQEAASQPAQPALSDGAHNLARTPAEQAGRTANAAQDKSTDAERSTCPPSFCCPISMDLMSDPVMIATGHTYDRKCIETWLASGHRSCPLSGQRLRHLELTPNIALRSLIHVRSCARINQVHPAPASLRAQPFK